MKNFFIDLLKNTLRRLAQKIILKYQPDIIAITGTVGKTSTKEAIFSVLSNKIKSNDGRRRQWKVWKSKINLNTELGIPLAIFANWKEEKLKLVSREQPKGTKKVKKAFFWFRVILTGFLKSVFKIRKLLADILVLEYGADRPGDIKYLLKIARPKIAVVTAIGKIPVHVEFYENAEEVAKEKGRLVEALFSGGYAVLNCDDELVLGMKEKTRATIMTFGFNEAADVRISNFENVFTDNNPAGISFKIEYQGTTMPVNMENIFGRAQAYGAAAAFSVGIIYGMNLVEIAGLLEKNYKPVKRRMNLLKGINNSRIIDDSYNASPLSMEEAISTVKDFPAKRKVGILGDMLELGKYSDEAHKIIGESAGELFDILVTIGQQGKLMAQSAKDKGMKEENIFSFTKSNEAIGKVRNIIQEGDLVLVKASRGIGLDRIVDEIRL